MDTVFGSGLSRGGDGREAGRSAADRALTEQGVDRVDLCQVFCADGYEYEAVIAGVRESVGEEATLIGCSATGQFTDETVANDGVLVSTMASDSIKVFTSLGTGLRDNVAGTVREAVDPLPEEVDDYPYYSAMVLHDGLAGLGEQLALLTQQQLGPHVQFAGGAASDSYTMEGTHVFHEDDIVEDGIVIALMATRERPIITVEHGHEPISDPVEVTKADGNVVHELDGRPAYEVWKDIVEEPVREQFGVEIDEIDGPGPELTRIMGEFEFGLDQGRNYKIRWPRLEPTDEGELTFAVDVPEGTVLRVMHGSPDDQIESARDAARQASEAAEGTDVAGAVVFDCACREIILQDEFSKAVEAIDDELDCPIAGFETYGELCMQMGQVSGFHNTTTVILLLPE
jgi:methyl-accepting chemotaxis protein